MKDLLKDFNIRKSFNKISENIIYELMNEAKIDVEAVKDLRASHKKQKSFHDELAKFIENQSEEKALFCYRVLRIAYFFQEYRKSFIDLSHYICLKHGSIEENITSDCKSEAEQVIRLYRHYGESVREYFIISLFAQQSNRYHLLRNDYSDDCSGIDKDKCKLLQTELLAVLKESRGCKHYAMQTFEYDDKLFVLFDFEDLPAETKEFSEGKPIERYITPSLQLAYSFNNKDNSVEVVGDNAVTRNLMHQTSAKVLFGKNGIPAKQAINEIYDLSKLLDIIVSGQPITIDNPDDFQITTVIVSVLRLKRKQYPFWGKQLDVKFSVKDVDKANDFSTAMQDMAKHEIEKNKYWQREAIEADHATLFAVYHDTLENRKVAKPFKINSNGGGTLEHSVEDEEIKRFLRAAGILRNKVAVSA